MSGSETDIQWFIARDGKQHGPVSDAELKKIIELAHLKPTDLVWRQGFTDWRAASSVFPEIGAPPAPAPAPQPAAPTQSSPDPADALSSPAAATPASVTPASISPSSSAPKAAATQTYAPYTTGPAHREGGWQPQKAESASTTTATRPEPTTATRTLGGPAQRTAGPFPAPGPGAGPASGPAPMQRLAPDGRKPADLSSSQPRLQAAPAPARGRRLALVAAALIAMTGVGAWLSSQYTEEVFSYLASTDDDDARIETGTANANMIPPAAEQKTAALAPAAPAVPTSEDIDRKLQARTMWVAVKQEFPDWYQARVAEVTRLTAEQKEPAEISRYLIGEIVSLRRENAKHALAASTTRHKQLAEAFLANLNRLSQESGDGCYDFISKGESSATIVERLDDPAKSAEIEAQVVATVTAIVEGKKQPAEHAAPVKTDYDVLAGELGRLGWTQADMQLFANPKALAQAPRARVCNMLKDWFAAHLAIQDPNTQERLLFETLKPVISG